LAQRIGELGHLALQGHAGGVVARGLAGLGGVAAEEHALAGADRAVGIASELKAQAAQAAAVVVGLVDQVAEVELRGVLRCGQLGSELLVAVVEDELVVAAALVVELGAFVAAQRCGVGLAAGRDVGGTRTMPGRAVAGGGVGLRAGGVVGALFVGAGILLGALAAGGGGGAGLALAVVEATDDEGPFDVAADEVHQHLLAQPGDELRAHAGAGPALEHAHPGLS
jgi:hypothetical protein